ncbi:MAG: zinc ribbon domain-containing protein [Acidobacteria bacterium]|nr:MAG: zinc ribbon domain-containing protein [Acidobacteriota bacterium]
MTHRIPPACPRCGARITAGQNFCRSCGLPLRLAFDEGAGLPPMASTASGKLHLLIKVIGEALGSGLRYLSPSAGGESPAGHRLRQCWRWGFIAFWAGLAAQLGEVMGFVLMAIGLGLMAYARGLFRTGERSDALAEATFPQSDRQAMETPASPHLSATPQRAEDERPIRSTHQGITQ